MAHCRFKRQALRIQGLSGLVSLGGCLHKDYSISRTRLLESLLPFGVARVWGCSVKVFGYSS